jgi:hypothetical protein
MIFLGAGLPVGLFAFAFVAAAFSGGLFSLPFL